MIYYDVRASFISEFKLLTAILFVLQDGVSLRSPDRPQSPTGRTLRYSDRPQWSIRKPQCPTGRTKVETVETKVETVETKVETI